MLRLAMIAALLMGLSLAACGGNDDDDGTNTPSGAGNVTATATTDGGDATGTGTTDATVPAEDDTTGLETAADEVFAAIQAHDRDRLRDATGDHDRQRIHDRDYDHLMECRPEGATMHVVDRTVTIQGDTATVVQTLELTTADGQVSTVERTLTFERSDDERWVLTALPECPFQE